MARKDKEKVKEPEPGINRPFAALARLVAPKAVAAVAKPSLARPLAPPRAAVRDESDAELFRQAVAGVQPLVARASKRVAAPPAPPPRPRVSEDDESLAALADLCDGTGGFDITGGTGGFDMTDGDARVEGIAAGIDKRLLVRLRDGGYAVQAELDLHGLARETARERVTRFIAESRRAGRRCVLIIHGRGLHSPEHAPVLKQAVCEWLSRGPVARAVLAFSSARPDEGGAGAVYVLLRS